MSILGLVLRWLEKAGVSFDVVAAKRAYLLVGLVVIPGFVLSAIGLYPSAMNYLIGLVSAFAQLVGFYFLFRVFWSLVRTKKVHVLIWVAFISLGVKFILQFLSAVPGLTSFIFESLGLVIAYLHLVFIGFVSFSLLALSFWTGFISVTNRYVRIGIPVLILGFVLSELLISYPSFAVVLGLPLLSGYFSKLLIATLVLFVGFAGVAVSVFGHRTGQESYTSFQ